MTTCRSFLTRLMLAFSLWTYAVSAETKLIPMVGDADADHPCNKNGFDLRKCIAQILDGTSDPVDIQLDSGNFALKESGGILIFGHNGVTLRGTPGSTRIYFDQASPRFPPILLQFFVHIINSSNVTISDLILDGAAPAGQRFHGIGVCPLGRTRVSGINIERIVASHFTDFFTMVGQTLDHSRFHGPSDHSSTAMDNLIALTGATESLANDNQYCEGNFSEIAFRDNTLHLQSVGFYLTPLTVRQGKAFTTAGAPFLYQSNGAPMDWLDVTKTLSGNNHHIEVTGNTFQVDTDGTFPDQAQLDGYFHSMLKAQGVSHLLIDNNNFLVDKPKPANFFQHGAAINIAANNIDTVISNNRITYDPAQGYPGHALVVNSGFIAHPYYGNGLLTATVDAAQAASTNRVPDVIERLPIAVNTAPTPTPTSSPTPTPVPTPEYGGVGLFGPSIGLDIHGNKFTRAYASINNCCQNTYDVKLRAAVDGSIFYSLWLTDFCTDIDSHQGMYDAKNDHIVFASNMFTFDRVPGGIPSHVINVPLNPAFVSADNATYLNNFPRYMHPANPESSPPPIAVSCRSTTSVTTRETQVCVNDPTTHTSLCAPRATP